MGKLLNGIYWSKEDLAKLKKNNVKLYNKLKSGMCKSADNKLISAALRIKNPKGFNKYKKNNVLDVKIVKEITKDEVQFAYREMWRAKNAFLSKCHKYKIVHDKFLGLSELTKQLELEQKE